ncbi:MAG: HAMP domain-containing histidine kinase [Cyanobacteria bacterium REEB459]|nr:HAMP domain-containing histidine kinase [Cyanobacteria bacterium REEB459]
MTVASAEFIALCRSQVMLLGQALGAISTVVYLADHGASPAQISLVPLVAYPETTDPWLGFNPAETSGSVVGVGLGAEVWDLEHLDYLQTEPLAENSASADSPTGEGLQEPALAAKTEPPSGSPGAPSPPLILPLVHEGVALGVIVSTRDSPLWSREDWQQGKAVANTLILGWVLDQRGQWLQQQLQRQHHGQLRQSETFHDLLHQFRNPITALRTFGKLLVKRLPTEDPNQSIAEGIVRESGRLADLAEDFDQTLEHLDANFYPASGSAAAAWLLPPADPVGAELARPEQSVIDLASSPHQSWRRSLKGESTALAAVVVPLLESAQAIAQDRGLQLWAELPEGLPAVWTDRSALGEVLNNLLDNALKYAPTGALVWLRSGLEQRLDGRLLEGIAVGDTGPGIPPQDQAQVFDRHYRGVQAQGTIPGTGLGLAIVQDLVTAMGGQLTLISPAPVEQWLPQPPQGFIRGPGTVFVVWLPVATDARPG